MDDILSLISCGSCGLSNAREIVKDNSDTMTADQVETIRSVLYNINGLISPLEYIAAGGVIVSLSKPGR